MTSSDDGLNIIFCPVCGMSGEVFDVEMAASVKPHWKWRFVIRIIHDNGEVHARQFWKDE